MYDWILWCLISAFVAWEAVAHYALRNIEGHTLSNRIAWLETEGGWPVRVVVACACLALGVHLEGGF